MKNSPADECSLSITSQHSSVLFADLMLLIVAFTSKPRLLAYVSPWSLFDTPVIRDLLDRDQVARDRKARVAFNLCSFVSSRSHYENLHSDIITALCDPDAGHGEQHLFAGLFMVWLQRSFLPGLRLEDFAQVQMERESGRVDMFLFDNQSKQAVIIENKMNNAVDQDRQLDRYVEYAGNRGCTVAAIVYLSLDGTKKAPPTEAGLDHLVCNAAAFVDSSEDLVNGWLLPSQEKAQSFQSKAFISQYIALIQSLASMSFDISTKEAFYTHVSSQPEMMKELDALVQLRDALPAYRAKLFRDAVTNPRPFMQCLLYTPSCWVFQKWEENGFQWKIDVIFHPNCVEVGFWNPNMDQSFPSQAVRDKLEAVGMLAVFSTGETFVNGVKRTFGPHQGTLREIDHAAAVFVNELLEALRRGQSAT